MPSREFDGEAYVRPHQRGIDLRDALGVQSLDEWLCRAIGADPYTGDSWHRLRITVETPDDLQEATDA